MRREVDDLEGRDDILSLLVAARHEDGSPMSDAEIHDELLTLLVAGHETTATALSWAVERLIRHPDKLARLRAGGRGRGGRLSHRDDPGDAAAATGDRRRPASPYRGDRAWWPPPARGGHGDAEHPFDPPLPDDLPRARRFPAQRFIETPPGTYTWIPFGGGVRRCIGAAFAQLEMAIVPARAGRPALRSAPPIPPPSAPSARDHRDAAAQRRGRPAA